MSSEIESGETPEIEKKDTFDGLNDQELKILYAAHFDYNQGLFADSLGKSQYWISNKFGEIKEKHDLPDEDWRVWEFPQPEPLDHQEEKILEIYGIRLANKVKSQDTEPIRQIDVSEEDRKEFYEAVDYLSTILPNGVNIDLPSSNVGTNREDQPFQRKLIESIKERYGEKREQINLGERTGWAPFLPEDHTGEFIGLIQDLPDIPAHLRGEETEHSEEDIPQASEFEWVENLFGEPRPPSDAGVEEYVLHAQLLGIPDEEISDLIEEPEQMVYEYTDALMEKGFLEESGDDYILGNGYANSVKNQLQNGSMEARELKNILGDYEEAFGRKKESEIQKALSKVSKPSERFGNSRTERPDNELDDQENREENKQRITPQKDNYDFTAEVKTVNNDTYVLGDGSVVIRNELNSSRDEEISEGDSIAYEETGKTHHTLPVVKLKEIVN